MKVGEHFYECASSGRPDELEKGPDNPFFTKYEQPPASMIAAWNTETLRFDEYTDEFGHFRSIFIPLRTPKNKLYLVGADVPLDFLKKALTRIVIHSGGLGTGILILVLLLSSFSLSRILKPIAKLDSHAQSLAHNDFQLKDDLQADLELTAEASHDEVGKLARTFLDMAQKLKEYIETLKTTTAAKERIESELRIAHDIQMSFLKKVFPPFPDRREFDLFAKLDPAKEVGGDLYDFFILDDRHLFFYVGDVSDKGVPAALFMAVTMTLMKRTAQHIGKNPAEILRQVNEELCKENENLMFVTLFCAILDFKTGEVVYSNAGHNPPVIMPVRKPPHWLELPHGPALGVMPGTTYKNREVQLAPEDSLLLYTDGVNEAMDTRGQQYTDKRLLNEAKSLSGKSVEAIIDALMQSVRDHAAGAAQSDDITILSLKLNKSG
jgi:sigma-B regulation protein RsbU (phosphoserine phosphatase)